MKTNSLVGKKSNLHKRYTLAKKEIALQGK